MFFPLGLGLKTKSFPFVTWLIIASCALFHFALQKNKFYDAEYQSLKSHIEVERAHDQLFYEYCKRDLNSGLCDLFALERGLFWEHQEEYPLFPIQNSAPSPAALASFAQAYQEFSDKLQESANEIRTLPSYNTYNSSLNEHKRQTQDIRERYQLLHHDNLTFLSALTAIFSHDNIFHLAGNMFFLFIFGRYVEARMGHIAYLLCYLVLGSAALALYAKLSPQPFLHVLGASANVSAVMGAFYALFFHQKLKIFFFYFAFKVAELPVKTYMFLFFMLQEFVFTVTSHDNVAYMAHALGLVFGAGFGYVWSKARPLPRDFLYEQELAAWNKVKTIQQREQFAQKVQGLLAYNPHNRTIAREAAERLSRPKIDVAKLALQEELLLRQLLPGHLKDLRERNELDSFFGLIEQLPHSWSISACLKNFSQKELLENLDLAIDEERLLPAVLFIQAFIERYSESPKIYNLLQTLKSVLGHMPLNETYRRRLIKIKEFASNDGIKTAIGARLNLES